MAATAADCVKSRREMWLRRIWKYRSSYAFMLPFTVIFCIFTITPVVIAIFYSFTYFNVLQPPHFVGMENYFNLFFEDPVFLIAIKNTLLFAVITGPVSYFLCLLIAWFINELPAKFRAVMTLLFYTPTLVSGSAYALFAVIFNNDRYGLLNSIIISLGIVNEPVQWFTDPSTMVPCVILVVLWMSLGQGFLAMIAGFQNVDRSLYEAAAVDGIHNRFQELWFITLPAMRGQLMFSAIISITNSFGIGGIITQLCGFPSSGYAAHTIMNHLTDYGGQRYEMGYACAIATLLFIVMVGSNKLVQKLLAKVGS